MSPRSRWRSSTAPGSSGSRPPYDKHEVDAYTRTGVILMNGVEVGAWNFSHHFARSTDDFEVRSLLARNLLEGAKPPSAQPAPASRTSSPPR